MKAYIHKNPDFKYDFVINEVMYMNHKVGSKVQEIKVGRSL